jgi:hypothetical protein
MLRLWQRDLNVIAQHPHLKGRDVIGGWRHHRPAGPHFELAPMEGALDDIAPQLPLAEGAVGVAAHAAEGVNSPVHVGQYDRLAADSYSQQFAGRDIPHMRDLHERSHGSLFLPHNFGLEEDAHVLGQQHVLVEDDFAAGDLPGTVDLPDDILPPAHVEVLLGLPPVR